eukprot:c10959_g1_i2.p1 GENE.c10959_g1_i2~~c10959_g1_i2.p1  ORF type:complete len:142 (+),score=19.71 c10959_g1_i2:147-572(+)
MRRGQIAWVVVAFVMLGFLMEPSSVDVKQGKEHSEVEEISAEEPSEATSHEPEAHHEEHHSHEGNEGWVEVGEEDKETADNALEYLDFREFIQILVLGLMASFSFACLCIYCFMPCNFSPPLKPPPTDEELKLERDLRDVT